MIQIWGLVLLCGLLTQSSARLEAIPVDPASVLSPAQSLTPPDISSSLLGGLTKGLLDLNLLGILHDLPILDMLKPGGGSSGGLIGGLLPKLTSIIPGLQNILLINVTNPVLLELGLEQSPDGHRLFVTIPLGMVLELKTLLTGDLLKLDAKLNIIVELIAVRDKDGKIHLQIGDCKQDPGSLKITLLERVAPILVQELVETVTKTLFETLPRVLQKEVCPLVNEILNGLDITLVHDVAELLIHGYSLHLKL
ncbi:BPI fold-containing family A member 1-like [Trichosurus vulpecula]|uniref:BPI fold-containing family A member 1-like n=1 Tax=Trichosurus vulpecula TaxID=9337 RepID=UPI00186AE2A1|nr:BPI fold-containing family A member 1-like [Trichosurus vulpecula]